MDPLLCRRALDFSQELSTLGWYHSFQFPDGSSVNGYTPISTLQERYAGLGLPEDLRGKRAIDIGAWDGWFSFELEKHGAEVVALDVVDMKTFRTARRLMHSKVQYVIGSVYDLPQMNLGKFDIVLFLGVLYHLRHPLLALEVVCGLCTDVMLIDSFVVEGKESTHVESALPWMEFYETDELGGQADNWYGPTVNCLMAMVRSAGFVRPLLIDIWHRHARVIAHRTWEPEPVAPASPCPHLKAALHNRNYGINFRSSSEEYVSCWFNSAELDLRIEDVLVEIGGFAVNTIFLKQESPGGWFLNCQLALGLAPGWHDVRLRTKGSCFSAPVQIAVDLQVVCSDIELIEAHARVRRIADACTFEVSCITKGLAPNVDRANTQVYLDGRPIKIDEVAPNSAVGTVLIQGSLPDWRRPDTDGTCNLTLVVAHANRMSDPVIIEVPDS